MLSNSDIARSRDLQRKARLDVIAAVRLTIQFAESQSEALAIMLCALDEIKIGLGVLTELQPDQINEIAAAASPYEAAELIIRMRRAK